MRRFTLSALVVCCINSAGADEVLHHESVEITFAMDPSSLGSSKARLTIKTQRSTAVKLFCLDHPSRLIFDLEEIEIQRPYRHNLELPSFVRRVRLGRHGESSRIVFDLTAPCLNDKDPETISRTSELTVLGTLGTTGALGKDPTTENKVSSAVHFQLQAKNVSTGVTTKPAKIVTENASAPLMPSGFIRLSTTLLTFLPGKRPVLDYTITNTSQRTLLLENRVFEVASPDGPPLSSEVSKEVLVSPRQLTLDPGADRVVRVLLANRTDNEERLYRIAISPRRIGGPSAIVSDVTSGSSSFDEGLAILVFVPPKVLKEDLSAASEPTGIVINNNGNVSVLLKEGEVCSKEKPQTCVPLGQRWLQTGTKWHIELRKLLSFVS